MKKQAKSIAAVALGAMLALSSLTPAHASSSPEPTVVAPVSQSDKQGVNEALKPYGITDATLDALWEKYETTGEPWDSMNGSEPVSEEEQIGADAITTVLTYEDGSISFSSAQKEKDASSITARGISGCTTSSFPGGAQYNNCLIQESNGWVKADFKATYYRSGSAAGIVSVKDFRFSNFIVSPSFHHLKIIKKTWSSSADAKAELKFHYQGLASGFTAALHLYVSPSSARSARGW